MFFEAPDIDPKLFDEWVDKSGGEWDTWILRPGAPDEVVAAFAELREQIEYEEAESKAFSDFRGPKGKSSASPQLRI